LHAFDTENLDWAIILSHGHLDHFGGAAKIQQASDVRAGSVEENWKMIERVGSP
jgi:glyoxylase-like metal-dependent hydrolase (beta-lactamase superfamily II)